jgi:alpha-galactosidase
LEGDLEFLHLDGYASSFVLDCRDDVPAVLHWGARLDPAEDLTALAAARARPLPQNSLDVEPPLTVLPDAGRGYAGAPGLALHREGMDWETALVIERAEAGPDQIRLHLADQRAGVAVSLAIAMDAESDTLSFATTVTNTGTDKLDLLWCASCCLPVSAAMAEMIATGGRWCREFVIERTPLPSRSWLAENRLGRTSHHNFPALALGSAGFTEQAGLVLGAALGWSGNHRILLERLPDGRRVLQCGALFLPGEIRLAQGESYKTPSAYATVSAAGLGGYTSNWHRFVRRHILPKLPAPRKVHLNTWEAVYFQHDHARLCALADAAAALGVERFVLDDGWFRNRTDDHRALGDWTPDPLKYPEGLEPLIRHVRGQGMEFGLWVEPEMVNPDSDLYRVHPDWALHLDGRERRTGRHQLVLDLGRDAVFDYLLDALDTLLAENDIAYLKWDMNRDLSTPGHLGLASVDRQTRAVYRLVDTLRERHPSVEIESCSSGGARADLGILARTHRVWPSDCNDALECIAIQRGFGLYLPPEVMGAHIGPAPAHTTGRRLDFGFQAMVALFGHFGLELDVTALDDDERRVLTKWIGLYKRFRSLLHTGDAVRLEPDDAGLVAHGVVSAAGDEALFSCARVATSPFTVTPPLRLAGLDPKRFYRVKLIETAGHRDRQMRGSTPFLKGAAVTLSGAALAAGLQLPNLAPESAILLHLQAGAKE